MLMIRPPGGSMKNLFTIGRLIFGGYFVYSGVNHFLKKDMLSGYAASKNVPSPDVAVQASGALALVGGASILTGLAPRWGAAALVLFMAGVTTMHRFWEVEDPMQRNAEWVNFMKNVGLIGAALMLTQVEADQEARQSAEAHHALMRVA
jgi:putative oxidoreductase